MLNYKAMLDFLYNRCLPDAWIQQDLELYPTVPLYRYLQAMFGYDLKEQVVCKAFSEMGKDPEGIPCKVTAIYAYKASNPEDKSDVIDTIYDYGTTVTHKVVLDDGSIEERTETVYNGGVFKHNTRNEYMIKDSDGNMLYRIDNQGMLYKTGDQPVMRDIPGGHRTNGAFELVMDIANTFPDIINPYKCPAKLFPYLMRTFGLEYKPEIENRFDANGRPIIYYQRKLLANIGALRERAGTISGIRFLVRVLTGYEIKHEYYRVDEEDEQARILELHLILNNSEDIKNEEHSRKVVEAFLYDFLPHYITVIFGESIVILARIEGIGDAAPTMNRTIQRVIPDITPTIQREGG